MNAQWVEKTKDMSTQVVYRLKDLSYQAMRSFQRMKHDLLFYGCKSECSSTLGKIVCLLLNVENLNLDEDVEIFKLLIEKLRSGVPPDGIAREIDVSYTPLAMACLHADCFRRQEVIDLLLHHGANPNASIQMASGKIRCTPMNLIFCDPLRVSWYFSRPDVTDESFKIWSKLICHGGNVGCRLIVLEKGCNRRSSGHACSYVAHDYFRHALIRKNIATEVRVDQRQILLSIESLKAGFSSAHHQIYHRLYSQRPLGWVWNEKNSHHPLADLWILDDIAHEQSIKHSRWPFVENSGKRKVPTLMEVCRDCIRFRLLLVAIRSGGNIVWAVCEGLHTIIPATIKRYLLYNRIRDVEPLMEGGE